MNVALSPISAESIKDAQLETPWAKNMVSLANWDGHEDLATNKAFLGKGDADQQRAAFLLFNNMMHRFTNLMLMSTGGMVRAPRKDLEVTRNKGFQLSTFGAFPDLGKIGIPSAVSFSDSDRRGVDMRWMNFVRIVDRRNADGSEPNLAYTVLDIDHGIEFAEYLLGETIDVNGISSDFIEGKMKYHAGAYQYFQVFERFMPIWDAGMGLAAMAARYADYIKKTAYARIANTAGLTPVAYATTGANQRENDILTINAGITAIETALYNAATADGMGTREETLSPNEPIYLLFNSLTAGFKQRWARAIAARYDMPNDNMSTAEIDNPIVLVGSPDIPLTNQILLTVGGRKNLMVVGQDLLVRSTQDIKIVGTSHAEVGQGVWDLQRHDDTQVALLATA